jgi:succinate-semialdehyde dehydrogenase/glutarate-semialdehyde dehydrogenase
VPFGGVKEFRAGERRAAEGLDEYLETKYLCPHGIEQTHERKRP